MSSGTYIGKETQFKGRHATLVIRGGLVTAQFDTGKLWETHSQLNFDIKDWKLDKKNDKF